MKIRRLMKAGKPSFGKVTVQNPGIYERYDWLTCFEYCDLINHWSLHRFRFVWILLKARFVLMKFLVLKLCISSSGRARTFAWLGFSQPPTSTALKVNDCKHRILASLSDLTRSPDAIFGFDKWVENDVSFRRCESFRAGHEKRGEIIVCDNLMLTIASDRPNSTGLRS